jgi:1-pyrroline-5-carboxylate dehydrogenase
VRPTIIVTTDPTFRTMREELFGPVLTAFVYEDAAWDETLRLVDTSTPYGLTGAVFARDRSAIRQAADALRHAAGNFYVNDKPTGAVVGQQPFGGARASGTNDKAGSKWNLIRWVSPRATKECIMPEPRCAETAQASGESGNVRPWPYASQVAVVHRITVTTKP